MRKTFLGVLVFMSQLIFAQGIEVISTKALNNKNLLYSPNYPTNKK